MNWFLYTLAAWFIICAIAVITQVGKQRKPIEPGAAAIVALVDFVLAFGLIAIAAR